MVAYYPPLGFYYKVEFGISQMSNDVRFQTVSGLAVEYDYESFKEGGENRFEHKLPVRTKYADLVLKRGMLTDSSVIKWFLDAFRDRIFEPASVNVILMNEKGEPLRTWKVAHAIPKKWQVSDFNANESAVVIETMELTYRYFTVQS
ncbi:phage tail protein [Methylicorpusculum sp.]|uniref:phage tail protein n=1 Tax=Methylicorpusculum sp. TaxID=2713644 RepID=UPI00271BA7F9|nr:phage tail protein [Methylicorpusculum sp.]MDO8844138.1 phage tail protein [Methylicorpusculum sp.]MDP2179854.1 phage tail protein [Methylicorpusculum sp.]MDP3528541.1 phage tail protein [Methylicorpusculum sp.]MDZ4153003.1 phage tail protein [Methylicorpusculum sp.]